MKKGYIVMDIIINERNRNVMWITIYNKQGSPDNDPGLPCLQ